MKAASSPETEPDFYAMEPCLPTSDGTTKVSERPTKEVQVLTTDKIMPLARESNSVSGAFPLRSLLAHQPHSSRRVSPDSSPRHPMTKTLSCLDMVGVIPPLLPDNYGSDAEPAEELPHNGDEVLFEGQSFRYLDHLETESAFLGTFETDIVSMMF